MKFVIISVTYFHFHQTKKRMKNEIRKENEIFHGILGKLQIKLELFSDNVYFICDTRNQSLFFCMIFFYYSIIFF